MAFKEVKEFEYITIAEAKEIMEKIAEERKQQAELLFETRRALKHLRTFSKLPAEDAKKLVEELMALPHVGRKDIAVKLADIMPKVPDEVRTIFAKERFTLTPEQIQEILDIIAKYR
ncbi:RNA polymerase Rpb4 family protein [Archaeoglobus veneficus]|uniref:DNA-directed RNA polymerase subunit Rpo4 n=1 Tax=Archaeoglobus veneficus (strain DSM 11195 / SNP6) TaxID=693661 RepID=F2KPI5_ARCVS|nr:RNA polymerase Rpb4 family protein [Archaeoglobus veneficus]AEA46416.1 RNA polymerase Rpb4 [Archaeoglobus veneficus SNP6]